MAANLKSYNILVIEDDEMLSEVMLVTFELAGATVRVAHSGETGLQLFHEMNPDLVVLDVRLPGITGWDVLKFIRIVSNTPVVMLTTMREDQDQIKGLTGGADAYLTKPFSAEVLVAQLEAVLRRAKRDHEDHDYEDDYLRVNLGTEQLFIQGIRCDLTGTEFKLLAFLVRHAGQICTYDQILGNVWGWEYRDNVDCVHVHASNLRRKIEHNPRDPIYIVTERGVGYRFEPQK